MRISFNSTAPTSPAAIKALSPDTGVPVWLDIVIGAFFGFAVLGCLVIYLFRRYQRMGILRNIRQKQADVLSHEARKQGQHDDFVVGPWGAGYGIYALESANSSVRLPSLSFSTSNASKQDEKDRFSLRKETVDGQIIQPLRGVKLVR